MLGKIKRLVLFRNQYFLFITTVCVTILCNQFIIQYDINQQKFDAELINIAGRQRMLSQRVAKLILQQNLKISRGETVHQQDLDTLSSALTLFEVIHYNLLLGSDSVGVHYPKTRTTDSLLQACTPEVNAIIFASRKFLNNPSPVTVHDAVEVIEEYEPAFLLKMEQTVNAYQKDAEGKLSKLKRIELTLAGISIGTLVLELFFLFLPLIRRLRSGNRMLKEANRGLREANRALHRNQQVIENNLSEITTLRNNIADREQQYRELIENASDMIYELDEEGRFRYVNPLMTAITGYSQQELLGRRYFDILHPNEKETVMSFYKNQRDNCIPLTYCELFIQTKDGMEIRIGQNVRMTFSDKWVTKVSVVARDITVLYKAYRALHNSEELFRSLAQNAPVGIYQLDVEGNVMFINQRWFEIVGLPSSSILEDQLNAIHSDDRERVVKAWMKAVIQHRETSLEFRYETSAKGCTWVANKLTPVINPEKGVSGFIGTISDVTAIKESQRKLEEGERRFRLLADNAPVGIFETDANGYATYMNKMWYEITGLDEDGKGDRWINGIFIEDQQQIFSQWKNAVREKREITFEFRFANKTRGIRHVVANAILRLDEQGDLKGYIGTLMDITDLKEAQFKVAESEKLYRLLSTNAKDLMTLHKADQFGTRIYVSPSVREVLGYEPQELIGSSIYEYIMPDDWRKIKEEVQPKRLEGQSVATEFRMRRKDGTYIWLESYSNPFYDEQGTMIGFQTSARDITLRKDFECSLQKAKLKAEEATKAKTQFLSMMSHEIRTPMNGILGLTNLLLEEKLTDDQKEKIRLLKFSGDNLLRIINDILDLNKVEAGKIVLEEIDFHLHDLVANLQKTAIQHVQEKQIDIRVEIDANVPRTLKGDPFRLGQVLNNLLSNAIKFTDRGSVVLAVKWKGVENDRHKLHFSLTDTGIGIPADKLEQIFESFSQASVDTTRKFGGTGLGLSISKYLLELMNSSVKVESKLGEGSRFSFFLLLREGAAPVEQKAHKNLESLATKVLLVEDNMINQMVAINFLQRWGITVDCAMDGKEAIELIKNKSYQMVLMDLQMPEMDGYEATRQIRSSDDPYFLNVPIIALTASAMSDTRERVLETGMNDFITKPFEPDELRAKIERYLHNAALNLLT